jgi:hypothetical protein
LVTELLGNWSAAGLAWGAGLVTLAATAVWTRRDSL